MTGPAASSSPAGGHWPAGVIFDCDGTLADTEPLSDRAWSEVLADHGYTVTAADLEQVIGRTAAVTVAYFTARAGLQDPDACRRQVRTRFQQLFDNELRLFPDAVAALRAVVDQGVPVAVASSSTRAHVQQVLAVGGLRELVSAVVGADDVTVHKPAPAPYLAAAAALGVAASDCTAVEDTVVGVTAARAAGMFTVAVARRSTPVATLEAADRVVRTVTAADLLLPP